MNTIFVQVTKKRKTRSKTDDVEKDHIPEIQSNTSTVTKEEQSLQSEPHHHESGVQQIDGPSSSTTIRE